MSALRYIKFLTVSLVFKVSSIHTTFPYYLLLWAVNLWCPLHRSVFTMPLNVFHLDYSFIVHLLFSLHCLTIKYCSLAFDHVCIFVFRKKLSSSCNVLLFFFSTFFSKLSQFLQEFTERLCENTTKCNL